MRVMGFDYGHKKIGIAFGQSLTGTATALATLPALQQKPDWEGIEKLIQEWKPDQLVVGMPTHLDGTAAPISKKTEKFTQQLQARFSLPCTQWDERLTTRAAQAQFKANRQQGLVRKKQQHLVDALAARLIVEAYLSSLNHL